MAEAAVKFFAVYNGDRLVAEAPLVVHDLDAAIDVVTRAIGHCGAGPERQMAAEVLDVLVTMLSHRHRPSPRQGEDWFQANGLVAYHFQVWDTTTPMEPVIRHWPATVFPES